MPSDRNRKLASWFGVASILLLCSVPFATRAEVAADRNRDVVSTIVVGVIVDDPNPIGLWFQHRANTDSRILNPDGDPRGDGRPDLFFGPSGRPTVAWAYNLGTDHDIAFSQWNADAWSTIEFVTASTDDERDPRIFVEPDGTLHVVWWTAGAIDRVYLQSRQWDADLALWTPPVQVSADTHSARRPSVVVHQGQLLIAYERSFATGEAGEPVPVNQEIIVATRASAGDAFSYATVVSTTNLERLDPILHRERGQVWLDWIHDFEFFGCSERRNASWSPLVLEPRLDDSWLGEEQVRRIIRRDVLGP